MKQTKQVYLTFYLILLLSSCTSKKSPEQTQENNKKDSLEQVAKMQKEAERQKPVEAADINLKKEFLYDKHSLEDTYPYKDTTRNFQWDKIKERLAYVVNFQKKTGQYAILQNYKNKNREAPVVKHFERNAYTRVSDSLGVERYQSAPLYVVGETDQPIRYGRDGSLVRLMSSDTLDMVKIEGISFDGTWDVPKRYVKAISDSTTFNHVVVVDVRNQNICTLEGSGKDWTIRSMNPATSGRHKPPHAQETPVGLFMIQEHKSKMFYYKDGTTTIDGFAPYASRFTNGAYIHGIPVNKPATAIIEYSASLGTVPRSHMCVRNASSHAKFVYNWAKPMNALVIVID
ncbi:MULTISPECIES: L,D-transpeptidase [unclassified Sphingobacterium]|uniref:L,D-transpeptidase n=1 Tax=unclassified Sphingobacterium TaxID=2609468 RepID=UPI0025E2F9E6|nr:MULTISPECIES: L,D-transpeptidase [unclassified Sphingobacterium]